ncbi:hypothetical protein Xedl_03926 [Xenorhabdus eapokensis]|uniref:Uncharacterized protein n=1 Tax=Xenorhabdus eapokensis TaxID=1873482 RepID=A0A1Q5TBI1_9GAMM|nr:hypothetical protein Xedl_03926 [Xenorhabdus eapokensis]
MSFQLTLKVEHRVKLDNTMNLINFINTSLVTEMV